MQGTMFAAFAECLLMVVPPMANILGTTAPSFGVYAVTPFIFSASPSGCRLKQNRDAHFAGGPGSSNLQQQPLLMQQMLSSVL